MLFCISAWIVLYIWVMDGSRYQSHEDEFYNDTGAYPSARIPLIKPYELYSKEGEPWGLGLDTGFLSPSSNGNHIGYINVIDVRKLSIENNVIMAYSPYVDQQVEWATQEDNFHWFVVVPDKHIKRGFNNEEAFLEYIQQFDIQEPHWQNPYDIFGEYIENECLEWIPDCN
jgi:hypothetical protein